MTEIDLHAITRRLEIIKAESSQGGTPSLSTFRNVSDVLADVPGLVDEVRWRRAAMTTIGLWFEQRLETYVADESSEYWRGYCDAQHEILLSARELMKSLEAIR